MKLIVKYLKKSFDVEMPDDATFASLQQTLHNLCHVTPRKQRLLIAGRTRGGAPEPTAKLVDCGVVDGTHIMLVGTASLSNSNSTAGAAAAGEARYADPERLVVRRQQVETGDSGSGLYACSYSLGYICQSVFVCRTCITAGNAAPQHVMCSGCAVVCHAGHTLEWWGRRLNVRCDCCTTTMGIGAAPVPCKFIADESTNEFPELRLAPNDGNTYPGLMPDGVTAQWCACGRRYGDDDGDATQKDKEAESAAANAAAAGAEDGTEEEDAAVEEGDDADEDDGNDGPVVTCVVCGHCSWATHLTHVNVDWVTEVDCYGEVKGELVYFHCHTCNVDMCLPCRLHCHLDHECTPADLYVDPGVFNCECGSHCAIPDGVAPDAGSACRARVQAAKFFRAGPTTDADDVARGDGTVTSTVMAAFDVTSDGFLHYVCEPCLAKHPWLLDIDGMRGCWGDKVETSELFNPPAEMATSVKPTCRFTDTEGHVQRHGAVIPNNLFSEMACQCETCQNAFRQRIVGCACLDAPVDLFFSTERSCSNCEASIPSGAAAFVCVNCELQAGRSLGGSWILCATCHARRGELAHDPHHEFTEDSGDNLFRLFSAGVVQQLDPDAQLWMVDHWREAQGLFLDYVRDAFGSRRLRDCDGTSSDGTSSLRSSMRSAKR